MQDIEVIAPNLKHSLSGVTTTVIRLLPIQQKMIGIRRHRARPAGMICPISDSGNYCFCPIANGSGMHAGIPRC